MGILEVRFRWEESSPSQKGWVLRLVDGRSPERPERSWQPPETGSDPDALFWSLFHPDRDLDLIEETHQLRLRPESLVPPGPMPPAPWSTLRHPLRHCHLLDAGWTLMEVTRAPTETRLSGRVCVSGESLHHELRRRLGPRVVAGIEELRSGDLIVVEDRLAPSQQQHLQDRARKAMAALICWTSYRPARSSLPQVHPTAGHPISARWVSEFLWWLLRGEGPEWAFARAGFCEAAEDHPHRWLTGHIGRWLAPQIPTGPSVPSDWFVKVDRSQQDQQLRMCMNGLVAVGTTRRVLVVLSSGPLASGLDLFQARTAALASEMGISHIDGRLAWTKDPDDQEGAILRFAWPSCQRHELATRLMDRGLTGEVGLALLSHEICTLDERPAVRRIDLAHLQRYLQDLASLSVQLSSRVRLLVHISVVGEVDDTLRQLKSACPSTNTFMATVLHPLGAVPPGELETWLDSHVLEYDADFIEELAAMSYDDLIFALTMRYPGYL